MTNAVALADLSVFSKFDVTGPDTRTLIDSLGANGAPGNGRIGLIHALTPAGGVLSEFTVTMWSDTHAYLTSAAAAEESDLDVLLDHAKDLDVTITNQDRGVCRDRSHGPEITRYPVTTGRPG